ncbi:Hypothetical predicted protein [Octopus vulgaris]|uniref:Uncharacterized protein n=1 Tax=Octopus vulgaris TaxID=6645 RepID=A0AA36FC57_OCTVU|nr:Hypothetical predicted protein [Octopus vulgaris]
MNSEDKSSNPDQAKQRATVKQDKMNENVNKSYVNAINGKRNQEGKINAENDKMNNGKENPTEDNQKKISFVTAAGVRKDKLELDSLRQHRGYVRKGRWTEVYNEDGNNGGSCGRCGGSNDDGEGHNDYEDHNDDEISNLHRNSK